MLSGFLGVAEIALEETESKKLAAAITNLTELYEVKVVDEKTMAWLNLAGVAGMIYGPRIATVVMVKKQAAREAAQKRQPVGPVILNPNVTAQM